MVLCSLHRLSPQALRFLCIEVSIREFLSLVLILGVDCPLPYPLLLSQSADFSSPLPFKASFGVRLYVSIVWVGH